MPDLVFKDVWRRDDPAASRDAKAFWARLNLVRPEDREQRAQELCVLAYSDGALAAVSTAKFGTLSGLRAKFAFYAVSVDPRFRQQSLGVLITAEAKRAVEAWSAANPEEQVMGLAAVIQSDELRQYQRRPVWDEGRMGLNLIGYGPHGEQIRVAWFRHARV